MPNIPTLEQSVIPGASTQRELLKTYQKTVEVHAGSVLRNGEDWAAFAELKKEQAQARSDLIDDYEATYDRRVEKALQDLYDDASHFDFDHPAPGGGAGTTETKLRIQAHRNVQTGHHGYLDRLEVTQTKTLLAYLDAQKGKHYAIIFDDLKRFARDTEFHFKLRREFAMRGAQVECLNFTFENMPKAVSSKRSLPLRASSNANRMAVRSSTR